MAKVLIIGAGAAGLAAANEMAGAGWKVTVLEAQNRIGGRVHTVEGGWSVPIELGAEFLHGEDAGLWNLVRGAGLCTHKVPEQNWEVRDGGMRERPDLWKTYARLIERVDMSGPDECFASFIRRQADVDEQTKAMVTDYVEGFNAADANIISVQALVKEEQAEDSHATSRVSDGYIELMRYLLSQAQEHGEVLQLNTLAKTVRWQPGKVEVDCLTPEGSKTFFADAVIVTVPLGVLQGGGAAGLGFVPGLEEKMVAASRLEMGNVIKIILQFRSRFWPIENFGFIHDPGQVFPTWWSDERGPILTGWVGGRRAVPLLQQTPDMILVQALETLGAIFPVKQSDIRAGLEAYYYHNWADDPYSLGAYSFVPVGSIGVPGKLAEPVANTLFFAGEATAPDGEQGTVGSAIASGARAGREILNSKY